MGQKTAIKNSLNKCNHKISALIVQNIVTENAKRGLFGPNKYQIQAIKNAL